MQITRRELLLWSLSTTISAYFLANPLSADSLLEYTIKAKEAADKAKLTLKIQNQEAQIAVGAELRFRENSLLGKIDVKEDYESRINPKTLSTISFSQTQDNYISLPFFEEARKSTSSALFFPAERKIKRTDKERVYSFQEDDVLKDFQGNPILLDPISMYYFLMHRDIEKLQGKRVLCSSGKSPWTYEFCIEKQGDIYVVNAKHIITSNKKDASFICWLQDSKITKIKRSLAGILNLEMELQPQIL